MLKFVQTCGACPEQYDVYEDNKIVGYIRLRHGYFSVRCPDSSGQTVLEAEFEHGLGIFEDDFQRKHWLSSAAEAINIWLIK